MLGRFYESFKAPDDSVKENVRNLYQAILNFQLQSVLRFYRSSFKNLSRDMFRYVDWEEMLQKVKDLEELVRNDLYQVNDLKSTRELENLSTTAKKQFDTMKQLLSIAERHLKVDVTYEWYKNRIVDRVEGTCEWFQGHQDFKSCLQQDSGVMVVTADPGCGKSVLAKHLIDNVLPSNATVCYFFFKDQDQCTISQALCALLHQLLREKPFLIHHAMKEYNANGKGLKGATETLWSILRNATQDPQAGPVIIVLDALDECQNWRFQPLIKALKPHHLSGDTQTRGQVKYLLTTRPYDQIMWQVQPLIGASSMVHIPGNESSDAISEEVNKVIEHKVNDLAKVMGLDTQKADHLTSRLRRMEHRTYLWVYLVFDDLHKSGFENS
ncbi:hypothetical protein QQZ08_000411 [Neonectria magnoliae]|uniref:AAA+ ATPase domain-containing protein n=1 Tax=Neonectria magnoliae TaxID=2732573 RepID=A0ABR1IID7_9HYPO